jgi:DNA-binding response OmpR family regulator
MTAKGNILVVDDEPVERQALAEILRLEGYYVASVANGEAAIDHIRSNSVDVMILDLRMPGMNGLDVVKVVNRIAPDIEIVLLTAHGSMETAIDALRNRVHDYLLKPATPSQILDSLERGLARRKSVTQERKRILSTLDESRAVIALDDGIVIDFGRRVVQYNQIQIFLTPAEGRLLKILVENAGQVFSHRDLVLLVQGYSATQQEAPEILRPLVSRLRQKLIKIPALAQRINSVRGTGYLFETG